VRAGAHLRSIWGEETRLDAEALSTELAGVQILDLATVTPREEPRVAPVDGLLFRGQFWFGSAESSARFRNIRANPAVSGAVTHGLETFLVIVHGRAIETNPRGPEAGGSRSIHARCMTLTGTRCTRTRLMRGSRRARSSRSSGVDRGAFARSRPGRRRATPGPCPAFLSILASCGYCVEAVG